jgi:hypothetical protein
MTEHEHDTDHDDEHDHDAMDECIEACLQCHVVCTMSAQYCLIRGGEVADAARVGLLIDCAQICQTSADFMTRGSPYHAATCGACAEVCRACAEACRSADGDEELAHCAEVCDACAEQCEAMSAMG